MTTTFTPSIATAVALAHAMNLAFNKLSGAGAGCAGGRPGEPDGRVSAKAARKGQTMPHGKPAAGVHRWCVLCLRLAQHIRNDSHDPLTRQTALNASLIKSTDRGRTWTRSAQENYEHPMWPGGSFGAPFFVHYGRNGGQVEQDRATQYVYACSTNGFWNDGDSLILGRVLRSQLSRLNSADWEYLLAP